MLIFNQIIDSLLDLADTSFNTFNTYSMFVVSHNNV